MTRYKNLLTVFFLLLTSLACSLIPVPGSVPGAASTSPPVGKVPQTASPRPAATASRTAKSNPTATGASKPAAPSSSSANMSGCAMFPPDNIWNTPIDKLPVNALSEQWLTSIGKARGFHPDFGSGLWKGGPIGIPYNLAGAGTPKFTVSFEYAGESDPGPYPIVPNPNFEFGSDHHLLTVDSSNCTLYEIYAAHQKGADWTGGSGAIWDLSSNALRPAGWTSADAAGLPILPGLVRYDEVASGQIKHALRFTASATKGYIWPARHLTTNNSGAAGIPPMGARFRLKADFDISAYPPEVQVILQAMKTYGIMLADNGSNWFISGAPDPRWNDDDLHTLSQVKGSEFEAVDTSGLMKDPDSGAVR